MLSSQTRKHIKGQRQKLEQRQIIHHASLVVQALLEVPQSVLPEVIGTLAQERGQLGVIQALNVRMSALTKHGPDILVLQLPVHLTRLGVMQNSGLDMVALVSAIPADVLKPCWVTVNATLCCEVAIGIRLEAMVGQMQLVSQSHKVMQNNISLL